MHPFVTLLSLFSGLFLAVPAWPFIPPVPQMIRDVFEGRKPSPAFEMVLRHRIEIRPGETLDLEEQYIGDVNRGSLVWRVPGGGVIGGAAFDRKNYVLGGDRRVAIHTFLTRKYLLSSSSEDFLNSLLAERFVTREQLQQYKPEFNPSGDPQNWDVKSNVLQHDGVFLKRVKGVPAYCVTGGAKSVYFDKGLAGIRRLEWKEGTETLAWNFDSFSKLQSGGEFPRRMSFERNGSEIIVSELVLHRPAKEKQISDLRQVGRGAITGNNEEALRLLLGYR